VQRRSMKAWRLDRLGGTLRFEDAPIPEPRPGGVVVRVEACALMSYLKAYVEGRLPIYSPPDGPFTPGGNAIGIVHAVGREVYHVKVGQRVVASSHIVTNENAPEPAQFLLGITAGPAGKSLQADWRDGTLAEYTHVPKSCVTPIDGLGSLSAAELSVLPRFAVPYGGLLRGRLAAGETLVVSSRWRSARAVSSLRDGTERRLTRSRNAAVPAWRPLRFREMSKLTPRLFAPLRAEGRRWPSISSAARKIPTRRSRRSRVCAAAAGLY
jgi:alcohol dehydrogenase